MVDEETSIEDLEKEIFQMMETGIVLSVIIQTSLGALNVIGVVNHAQEAVEVAEIVDEETTTEVQETAEMVAAEMADEETSTEVQEIEEMEVVEISQTVTKIGPSREKISSVKQRVKDQVMLTTTHQNLLFHENLIEIVMIK